VATTSITLAASHKVLITGQFTAETATNAGDMFAQVVVDSTKVDGLYWTNIGATAPGVGYGRASLSVSTVVTLAAGAHTVKLQAAYYNGGTAITLSPHARRINAIDLG
jgi:hypothetical protein